jgi:hypothetical protein
MKKLIVLILFSLIPCSLFPATVILSDGSVIHGKIIYESDKAVFLENKNSLSPIKIQKSNIVRMEGGNYKPTSQQQTENYGAADSSEAGPERWYFGFGFGYSFSGLYELSDRKEESHELNYLFDFNVSWNIMNKILLGPAFRYQAIEINSSDPYIKGDQLTNIAFGVNFMYFPDIISQGLFLKAQILYSVILHKIDFSFNPYDEEEDHGAFGAGIVGGIGYSLPMGSEYDGAFLVGLEGTFFSGTYLETMDSETDRIRGNDPLFMGSFQFYVGLMW